MKIGVCIKEVADTATKIEIRPDALGVQEANIKFVMNPYDEFALEEALKLKDKDPQVEVVTFTIGSERAAETIRKGLAMGADRAVHLQEANLPFGEGLLIAQLLAKMVSAESLDALFLGKQAIDDDSYQVGPMLAGVLDWPQAMNVIALQFEGSRAVATREVEGGTREIIELQTPFVAAMTKGINEPRYPALKGIMAAKKKEIKTVTLASLGVQSADYIGFRSDAFSLPPQRQAVKMIQGEPAAQAAELVRILREEAKVL